MKALSISVAAYNAEKCLKRCLDSFLVSDIMSDIEVLVVNDGSTDGTKEIALEYTSKYPGVFHLIDKANGGHGSTINAAIQAAQGKYFKIVDSDDWVEKEGIVDLVGRLRENIVDAVISPYFIVNAEQFEKQEASCVYDVAPAQIGTPYDIASTHVKYDLTMHAMTFRTAILKENFIPIDEHCFYVDMEYLIFYFDFVKTVLLTAIPVYDYLVGDSEQSVSRSNMIKRRGQHLRVCRRVLGFYGGSNIINKIIQDLIIREYGILMMIPELRQSRKELEEFEKILKEEKNDVYSEAILNGVKEKKETAMAVFLLRKVRFHGYALVHFLICKKIGRH